MLKKCFGIPSWLPEKEPARTQRKERINRLFKQLNDLWPDVDILVIAQNWKDFKPIKTNNKQIIKKYPELGILGARKTLQEEFLKLKYDYIIMFDDDAIIETKNNAHIKYMELLDKYPQGFCFMPGKNSNYHPYCAAQLNLCAISRFIYEQEPMVDIDPQKDEGFEDSIYACLLYQKWNKYEFKPPVDIRCTQFLNTKEQAPSTWAHIPGKIRPFTKMIRNTNAIQAYITKYKKMPKDLKAFLEEKEEKKTSYSYSSYIGF